MTQDNLWELNYFKILNFIVQHKRRPSRHRLEEHQMLNWIKYQKKLIAQGKFKDERTGKFDKLLALADLYLRKNQYAYTHKPNIEERGGEDMPEA